MEDYRLRVRLFTGIIVLVLGVLVLRLVQLQIINTEEYTDTARAMAIRPRTVQPARGNIYDRDGTLLVGNEPTYTITITPRFYDPKRTGLLADLLDVPDSVVTAKVEEARAWTPFRPSPVFRGLSFATFSRVQEYQYMLPGVNYQVEQQRRYPSEATAAHVLGYVREITGRELARFEDAGYRPGDRIGKIGLERSYESYLRGREGSKFTLVNIRGMEVKPYHNGAEDIPPVSGYNLHLSLDADVQALAESLFVNKRGGAVALDPNTGEIIAMVSAPDFDPAVFTGPIDAATWDSLTRSPAYPLLNRATMMAKPPGSTWKPFMDLMALSEGLITPTETIYCPGYHPLGNGVVFTCMHVHGDIAVKEAIKESCNTFHFELMQRGNVQMLERYAQMFGFDQYGPLDILEQADGLVPDSAYFNRIAGKGNWGVGWTMSMGIGQGNLAVTPLQLARYTGAVATGKLVPPHLVTKLTNPETGEVLYPSRPAAEEIPIKEEYFEVVRAGMKAVMEGGTGYWVQIPGIPSAGKTGTAQNPHGEDHSVFILFAPYDDPQIAIGIIVENAGYGSTVAGPIASLMAELYLKGEIPETVESRRRFRWALTARSEPIDTSEGG